MNSKSSFLKIRNLAKNFGGVVAVDDFSLTLEQGEVVGLIGPNGAGKTTIFNLITGIISVTSGEISFEGQRITNFSPNEVTRRGIARTFQNIRLFKNLSVIDNVVAASHASVSYNFFDAVLGNRKMFVQEEKIKKCAKELLALVGLSENLDTQSTNLPYGHQRRLEIARALALSPRLLLLDEPAAGMNLQERDDLIELLRKLRKEFNLTLVLIEHHIDMVSELSERIYVLNFGKTLAMGTPEEVLKNPAVVEAYLGDRSGG